jgi:hypothetical protein
VGIGLCTRALQVCIYSRQGSTGAPGLAGGTEKKKKEKRKEKGSVRRPGIEPGSTAWKATMLTITPATLSVEIDGADVGIIGRGTGAFAGPWPPV